MPTPTETLQILRTAADVNAAALASVRAQAAAHLVDIESWPNGASKGAMRDQLGRLLAGYDNARAIALTTSQQATRVLNLLGSDPGPDPDPQSTVWSTGAW